MNAAPVVIPDRQEVVERLYAAIDSPQTATNPAPPTGTNPGPQTATGDTLTDAEVVVRASRAKNGAKVRRLLAGDRGDYGGDDSRADAALCAALAFWSRDPDQLDRIVRSSGLMRPKWDERRGTTTYGWHTINHALAFVKEWYRPPPRGRPAELQDFAAHLRPRKEKIPSSATPTDAPDTTDAEHGDAFEGIDAAAAPGDTSAAIDLDTMPAALRIVYEDYRDRFAATHRRGKNAYSATDDREITPAEATYAPTVDVVAKLQKLPSVPRGKGEIGDLQAVLKVYRDVSRAAWLAYWRGLPAEDAATELAAGARREFRERIKGLLLRTVQLQFSHGDEDEHPERRSIIGWCEALAVFGKWSQVSSYLVWARRESDGRVRIAFRKELAGQLNTDRELSTMPTRRFSTLCGLYDVGRRIRVADNSHRAIEPDAAFWHWLMTDEDADERGPATLPDALDGH
jgi:hypothetical protein